MKDKERLGIECSHLYNIEKSFVAACLYFVNVNVFVYNSVIYTQCFIQI